MVVCQYFRFWEWDFGVDRRTSNPMDRYLLSSDPHITDFFSTDEAIQRMQIAVSDSYDSLSVFSIYWKSDDTGGEDSSLFIDTLSKLQNVESCQRNRDGVVMPGITLADEIAGAASQSGRRKLLIIHYAGHAIAGSTPDSLIITPKIGQELGSGPEMDMSLIRNILKDLASKSLGLDVLLVIGSCCAGIAERGGKAKGTRVRGWSSCYCTQGYQQFKKAWTDIHAALV